MFFSIETNHNSNESAKGKYSDRSNCLVEYVTRHYFPNSKHTKKSENRDGYNENNNSRVAYLSKSSRQRRYIRISRLILIGKFTCNHYYRSYSGEKTKSLEGFSNYIRCEHIPYAKNGNNSEDRDACNKQTRSCVLCFFHIP